jgi:predicted GNAT family acetyltransferase
MAPELTDAPDSSRLELRDEGELLGWLEYLPAGDSVVLAHTEVAEGHEGEGLGGTIVRAALGRFAESGKTVIPTCPFAAAYIPRHPELGRFVDPRLRQDAEAG